MMMTAQPTTPKESKQQEVSFLTNLQLNLQGVDDHEILVFFHMALSQLRTMYCKAVVHNTIS